MSAVPLILIVDDEPLIRAMLRRYLSDEGFQTSEAADGTEMWSALLRDAIDLVLLDLALGGEDGLSLARQIRQRSSVPIIMLTSKRDLIDRVAGLELGADDYITKPFELREVLARVRAVMRRADRKWVPALDESPHPPVEENGILLFEGFRLDLVRRELKGPTGDFVLLAAGEFDLLSVFARHPNQLLDRPQLIQLLKGREWSANERTIDSQVARLRKKIEPDPSNPALVKTMRGGYIFAALVTPAPLSPELLRTPSGLRSNKLV